MQKETFRIPFLRVFVLVWVLAIVSADSFAESDQGREETLTRVLEGIESIRGDASRLEEILPWLEAEEARVRQELQGIDSRLEDLRTRIREAEESRQNLAEAFGREIGKSSRPLPVAGSSSIDFVRDIRPILSNNCVSCHGPDEKTRKGHLRLDILDEAVSEEGAIRPGRSADSPLIRRITTPDESDRMPPPSSGKSLKPDQIELLRRWIDEGAAYQGHWAFDKPVKAPIPRVSKPDWVRNEIDAFVLAKLDELGVEPSEEADRYTLIRRVSLDLTGLPPTPTETDEFIRDESPDAYERLVDRLLESPHFGERWARVWLDLARYADTMGYEKDLGRTIWRYRDWVIRALNEDMPFDRFTIEQLAGDLLENPSLDQRIATAFHRNTMTNTEGGTDDEEFRNAAVIDRVNTTMEVWMGLTMGCAQCHSHKYDPISNEEFYRFFAFFNQTADNDQPDESPTLLSPDDEQKRRLDNFDRRIDLARKLLKTTSDQLDLTREEWESRARSEYAKVPRLGEWYSVGPFRESDYDLAKGRAFDTPFAPEQGVDLEGSYRGGKLVWRKRSEWVDGTPHSVTGEFSATYLYRNIHSTTGQALKLRLELADRAKVFLNGKPVKEFSSPEKKRLTPREVSLALEPGDNALLIKLTNEKGDTQFSFKPLSPAVTEKGWSALLVKPDLRTESQRESVRAFQQAVSTEYQKIQKMIRTLETERAEFVKTIPTTPVMKELPEDKRRETHIQVKGNFLNPGKLVTAGVPQAFHDFPEGEPLNRLGLAKWLVSRDNPLTARVVVNRYWGNFFGRGLVETAEDFGTQGEPPSNQALLDWLAVDFMDQGWSLKKLCRKIVTSTAYRQSSKYRPELETVDPYNRYLARGPRFRLEAEMVRDQALRASGLLSAKMYGPPVMPPQPEGVWQVVYSGEKWKTSPNQDRYRRALYTYWRRTSPYPSMVAFDAPSREVCTLRRVRTNTPLQALVTLNDPAFFEAAQALARRTLREGGDSPESRAAYAFRAVLVRPPEQEELDRLLALFRNELQHFQEDLESAKKLATDPIGPVQDETLLPELGAWTVVGNVILNLDETLTRL